MHQQTASTTRRRSALAILPALALFVSLLMGSPMLADAVNPRFTFVATTGMVADIIRNVAGDDVHVVGLLGDGVDPHMYTLTRSDIARLMRADAVFYSGLLLEGKMTDSLERISRSGKPVFAVTESIDEAHLLQSEQYMGAPDPHVWMDPVAWSNAAQAVADRLAQRLDPPNAAKYRANYLRYAERLADLDAYIEGVIGSIPPERRVLITSHDAFNYFGRRYGLETLGIQGISAESEAGVRDIERLVDLLVERRIPAVFVETTVPQRSVRALIAGARARGHEVVIGGDLFSDAMGAGGTYEGTYIGMLDHNATVIARALGGEAPEGGMSGKLGQRRGAGADEKDD